MSVRLVTITEDADAQRLDNFLFRQCGEIPKSRIYNAIRRGEVRINKGRCKPSNKLRIDDVVRIPPFHGQSSVEKSGDLKGKSPSERFVTERIAEHSQRDIVFEDERLLVINKPAGVAVHGGSGLHTGLIESLRLVREDRFLELVHRLDRETSGLLMIARKRATLLKLQAMLQAGQVRKVYHAWVDGQWPKHVREVTAPLFKPQGQDRGVIVSAEGKASRTLFRVIARSAEATLLEVSPITGRTHQIRVHAAFVGCPVVGDERYGNEARNRFFAGHGVKRLCLHAISLGLRWEDAPEQTLHAEWNPAPGAFLEQIESINSATDSSNE